MNSLNKINPDYQKPSERAARFILGIFGWIKYIVGSSRTIIPRGQAIRHKGMELPPGKTLQFPTILLVEDDPNIARDFIELIKKHYVYGSVMIFVAHAHNTAVTFFENEDVNLVIMDADLDDVDGDGVSLARSFLSEKPALPILANSSSKISNLKLTGSGAVETVGKNPEKLKSWLFLHDPEGERASEAVSN
jgi:CheY-like chemotaxis protein